MEQFQTKTSEEAFSNGTNLVLNSSTSENGTLNATFNNINDVKAVVCLAVVPILVLIGAFGNISTIIVFCLKKRRRASSIFIIGLAFSDLLFLLLRFVANTYTIGHLYYTEHLRYVRPNSFFWFIISKIPQRIGNLFIIAIVAERFTAVWFPLQVRQVWTGKRSLRVSVALTILALADMVLVVDNFIFSLQDEIPEHGELSADSEAERYRAYYGKFVYVWSSFNRVLFDMLPLPVVFIFNIIIVIGIRKSSFSKRNWNTKTQERKKKETRKTRMLLSISVLFILLCSPFHIFVSLRAFGKIGFNDVAVGYTFQMLNVLNSVINFLVYGLNDKSLRNKYFNIWSCKNLKVDSQSKCKARYEIKMPKY